MGILHWLRQKFMPKPKRWVIRAVVDGELISPFFVKGVTIKSYEQHRWRAAKGFAPLVAVPLVSNMRLWHGGDVVDEVPSGMKAVPDVVVDELGREVR